MCFDLDDGFFNFNRYNAHSPQNGQTHAKNCAANIAKVLTCNHSVDPTYFTPFSSAFIVDFEQVKACQVGVAL